MTGRNVPWRLIKALGAATLLLVPVSLIQAPAHSFDCSYYGRLKVCVDVPSRSFTIFDPSDGAEITGVCGSGANWSSSWNDAFVHGLYYRICGTRLSGY